jgi:cell division protein FtsA
MKKGDIIVGLDVGTTKICAVVGEAGNGGLKFRGVSTSASIGMRKGVIVDAEAIVDSIRNAVHAAEISTGVEIKAVYVGISGAHIKGFHSYGAAGVRGKEVSAADRERVIDSAKAVYVPIDREVLHVIPAGYTLDGQNSIRNPIGMIGGRLEANVYILTGAATALQNLLSCCEKCGIEVIDIVFEPLASAEAILTNDEKELGVAIADVGGGTTDIILYKDGWLRHSSVLAVGGNHFTNDIAIGLKVSVTEAERVKKSFGAAVLGMAGDAEEIEIVREGHERKILRRQIAEILQPRTEELMSLIKKELLACRGYEIASMGVVLTGGGSLLKGFDTMAEGVLRLPVRIGFPRLVKGCSEIAENPMYATGAGLVFYGYQADADKEFCPDTGTGVFGKMKDWMKGIFNITRRERYV